MDAMSRLVRNAPAIFLKTKFRVTASCGFRRNTAYSGSVCNHTDRRYYPYQLAKRLVSNLWSCGPRHRTVAFYSVHSDTRRSFGRLVSRFHKEPFAL